MPEAPAPSKRGANRDAALVVLVSGCSSGLGRALAYELHTQTNRMTGEPLYRVFASARKLASISALEEDGMDTVQLDVMREDSVANAVAHVLSVAGRIDVLINNAAIARYGALLEQPVAELREVLEADVIGLLALSQAVGRDMVKRRSGVILNIGSVSANLTRPFAGTYCAAKAASRAVSEALRMELAPFNVDVVNATVGSFSSSLVDNAGTSQLKMRYDSNSSVYQRIVDKVVLSASASQDPKACHTAQEVAADLVGLLARRCQPTASGRQQEQQQPRLPGNYLAGGSVRKYTLYGFIQQWLWPALMTDRLMPSMFGLSSLANRLKDGEAGDRDKSL